MAKPPAAPDLTPADGRQLAADIFLRGFRLALMDAVRRSHPIASERFLRLPASAADLAGGLSHDDFCCLQSSAVVDLTDGPAVLHLPDMRSRYFSLTFIDSAGERFASLGARPEAPVETDVALAGPRWRGESASGLPARRAPSDIVWVVSRIVARSPADMPTVEALASGQWLRPWGEAAGSMPGNTLLTLGAADFPAARHLAMLPPETFLHRLLLLLERAPAAVRERIGPGIAARTARIGPADGWTDELRQALSRGFADAWAAIVAAAEASRAAGPGEWLPRGGLEPEPTIVAQAAHALSSLGAPDREDILDLVCVGDESGRALVGEELYRIHFKSGETPPAQAAWRLTASPLPYGEARGVVGDHSEFGLRRDGSLELLVTAESPAPGRTVNWLPAPHGPFRLAMRLYWPAPSALSGDWRMAPVERLGSRFARSPARPPAPKPRGRPRPRSLGSG